MAKSTVPKVGRSGNPNPQGNKGKGRAKGVPNKATKNAREAIALLVDKNTERLEGWLDQIAKEDGPKAAFQCLMDVMEYHVPKLARTELTGPGGGAIIVQAHKGDENL